MEQKPCSTPMVPPPQKPSMTSPSQRRFPLKSPIVVVAAGNEWEHEKGALTIGRDPDVNVALEDPLVSRQHARLSVQTDGTVMLEDLHSVNGVFVNGNRITRPSLALFEGDRLLLGTTEISVFSLRASATVPLERSKENTNGSLRSTLPSMDAPAPPAQDAQPANKRGRATTQRNEAIDMIGQFAEQLMESGHPVEAVRTLSEQLLNLLKGATAGLTVPKSVLESATLYALRLHEWTQRSSWIEFTLELHLASREVPSERSLAAIEAAWRSTLDATLVEYLVKTIEGRSPPPDAQEQQRLRRVARLGR